MKTKQVSIIEVSDWDELVMKTYGRPYSFQQQDDCKARGTAYITVPAAANDYENDAVPEIVNDSKMGVSFTAWLARDPVKLIPGEDAWSTELWWGRNFYPDVQMVANDLHSKGLLPAGEYGINIDW